MAILINGKEVSAEVKAGVAAEAAKLKEEKGLKVGLAVVIVGNNPASRVYVNSKKKACEEVGFQSFEYALDENTTQEQLLDLVDVLNRDSRVNGILVQLPLPKHIDENAIINAICVDKDVDAFHPKNVGRIMIGDYAFLPCTPAGVMELIAHTGVEVSGKNCVVIGRSNIVGKPMAMLLLHKSGTVTICHSKTQNIADITRNADILVVAVGKPNFVTGDMIKEGAVVIDVGMNRLENGKLCGDVEFASAEKKAGYITPVPGGVGPMTIAMLMKNTLTAAKQQSRVKK
ncbi:MAG: bifunctional methylenetetrahydrofolate dehydrogenase/methenyltetrahydrofolate cyclohydrolase FolD [Ruminococcus sp.]|jgi:methylenetetrahydrofolate dehydrogenase (NADP+)/methenyltetrahydrofolate cyclohydrolase|nr:bifunctional methylenetetrahydrofolate dehydrogenase/methenyltetrahydrofolate cyclohydrolase FolD [Ruminococcus sp.]